MAVRGGGLELTVTTTPAEMLSVAVNMAQNGWSFEECLELLGFARPGGFAGAEPPTASKKRTIGRGPRPLSEG
jgi:hypothetical protein